MAKEIRVADVVLREDLYPRIQLDPATVQKYAEDLSVLPPIEVNQHNILIDGKHRLTAHKKNGVETIKAEVTETASENDLLALAIKRNAAHGLQLSLRDKKTMAVRLYHSGQGMTKAEIADVLSVSERSVASYLADIDKDLRQQKKERIFDMWMSCHTQEQIAQAVGIAQKTVDDSTKVLADLENLQKPLKLSAQFNDDFTPEAYNIWSFAKKTNEVKHFGNSEQRIVENLLYAFTEPFDIVVDPFGGGGSTIDVCKKRYRRYYVSDRKPLPEREDIRLLDIKDGPPQLNKRWSEVSLTYLDPPYWKQAEGQYSNDADDLANQTAEDFHSNMIKFINAIASKQSKGVIALLIQPTQWKAPDKVFTDHVFEIMKGVNLPVINRVSCPYSTQQYNEQMVKYAKENKGLYLVLTRELIIWGAKR